MVGDGYSPSEPVRDLLDHPGGDLLASGFVIGVMSNQGFTFRGALEGGQQERDLAAKYDIFADQIAPGWPRAAAVLRQCAASYRRYARRWDEADDSHDEM